MVSNLSEKTRTMLEIVTNILSLVFILVLGYYGFLYTLEAQRANITSTDLLSYPVWILRLAFPVGALLGFLQMLRIIVRDIVKLAHRQLPAKQSWIDNPYFIIPLFLILLVAGTVLLIKNPVAGTIILIFLVLFGGMPIAFGMGFIGVAGLFICYKGFVSLSLVPVHAEPMLTNFIMLAVPMFIFAGTILEKTKIGELIFDFSAKWVGFLPGGLAVATVMACAIFSAMTGVSMAVAATISLIAVEALSARGYPKELIYGSIGGGALGSFIPPSIGLVIYGYLTGIRCQVIFGRQHPRAHSGNFIFPLCRIYSKRSRMQKSERSREQVSWKERFDSLGKTFPALLMPVIVWRDLCGFLHPYGGVIILVIYALIRWHISK